MTSTDELSLAASCSPFPGWSPDTHFRQGRAFVRSLLFSVDDQPTKENEHLRAHWHRKVHSLAWADSPPLLVRIQCHFSPHHFGGGDGAKFGPAACQILMTLPQNTIQVTDNDSC